MNGRPAKGRKPTKKEVTIKEKLLRRIKEYDFNWLQIPFAIFFHISHLDSDLHTERKRTDAEL